MAMTLVTLSVARTQVIETRMASNERWHAHLSSVAQSEWEKATLPLTDSPQQLAWSTSKDNRLTSLRGPVETTDGVTTTIVYQRAGSDSPLIDIEATAGQAGGAGITGRIRQTVRLLTVLSPLAETAPPLVVNGCLVTESANIAIRPIGSDTDAAGDALWYSAASPCSGLAIVDVHGGRMAARPLEKSLWSAFFSISRDEYKQLATSDLALPASQRRYWWIEASDLSGGKWHRSLGSTDKPVVMYFPPKTGCPRFAAGVRIVGFVFIDSACHQPLASTTLGIVGTVAINGTAHTGHAHVQLNHIQTADNQQTRLALPVIKVVKIPGSWKDF